MADGDGIDGEDGMVEGNGMPEDGSMEGTDGVVKIGT